MRVAILGNSGSGKSTLARWLAEREGAELLDLDTVAWELKQVAVPRPPEQAKADVRAFCQGRERWVVEGCYTDLIEETFPFAPRLIFLNPGEAVCVANALARPWEPHKYVSKQEQDQRLDFLILWIQEYYTRGGQMSLAGHRGCFERYGGEKLEVRERPVL